MLVKSYAGQTRLDGKYRRVVGANHIGLIDLLRKYNGDRLIDLMNIDVEGAEYDIFRVLHGESSCASPDF